MGFYVSARQVEDSDDADGSSANVKSAIPACGETSGVGETT